MHWLLASLLVLPPPTAPLPLVGLKLDARLTELVFQLCLCLAALLRAGVDDAMTTTLPQQKTCAYGTTLDGPHRQTESRERDLPFSPYGHRNPFPDVAFVRDKGALELP